jgi:hypothetical protein
MLAGRRKASVGMLIAAAAGHRVDDLGRPRVGRLPTGLLRQWLGLISFLPSPMPLNSVVRRFTAGAPHAF